MVSLPPLPAPPLPRGQSWRWDPSGPGQGTQFAHAVSSGLSEAGRACRGPEAAWRCGARLGLGGPAGQGERAGGPFSRDRSARRLSLNLRSDRSIRYFPLLPENSILGLELGPRLNLSGNQRGGDRDRDAGGDRDRDSKRQRKAETEKGRDREMLRPGERHRDSEIVQELDPKRKREMLQKTEIKSQRDRFLES